MNKYESTLQNMIDMVSPENRRASIITWCNNNGVTNFGQVLQCYALQVSLERLGFDVTVIDYQNRNRRSDEVSQTRIKRFAQFVSDNIHITSEVHTLHEVETFTSDCGLLICGSDQIWNPIHFDPVYYLDFGRSTQRRMAYAVSGIFPNIASRGFVNNIKKYIDKIDCVSVREKSASEILSSCMKFNVPVAPDPVFLLDKEQWNCVCDEKIAPGYRYALCVFLGSMSPYIDFVRNESKKCGCETIISIPSNIIATRSYQDIDYEKDCGPSEFLGLVKGSSMVFTDSYHATIFASIYGVECYCAGRKDINADVFGGDERFKSLKDFLEIPIKWIESIDKVYKPLVSIIMPVFNAANYLESSISDVLNQTYENIELICVDDGSTDDSCRIIRSFQKKDTRIRLIKQEHSNAGIARNNGKSVALGEYLIFLDADDIFSSTFVESMIKNAFESGADIVICGSEGLDERTGKRYKLSGALDNSKIPYGGCFSVKSIPQYIFQLTAGWAWDKCYRADFIKANNVFFQDIANSEDNLFTDIAYVEAECISVINEILITHRTGTMTSLEAKRNENWKCGFDMLLAEMDELKSRGMYQSVEQSYINKAASFIVWNACNISREYFSQWRDYYLKTFRHRVNFLEFNKEYFYSSDDYECICRLEQSDADGFQLWYRNKLNMILFERDCAVEELRDIKEKKQWRLPRLSYFSGQKVAVYGLGDVGMDICSQIDSHKELDLVVVCDREYEKYVSNPFNIVSPEEIVNYEFDVILVSIILDEVASKVKDYLIQIGIDADKIVCYADVLKDSC